MVPKERIPDLPGTGIVALDNRVVQPVAFDPNGRMNSGAWWERFPVSGCGNDTVLNIYFTVSRDSKVNTTTGNPGTTRADLALQHDALPYALLAANARTKECNHFDVKDTRFEAYGLKRPPTPDPGASDRLRPWWETWTVIGCGHTYEVPLNFIPHSTGTTIASPVGDVIER